MELRLYDTLTKEKRVFTPIDPSDVRMYVCGPTVYDFAHIGNARPVIVFDVLFRLLRHVYGADHVTYVRNITDVDDKINDRAARDFPGLPLNEAIRTVTEKTADQFQADVAALGCLPPTHQPRATEFVLPRADGKTDMVTLIKQLIASGHAYEAGGEVLFDVQSMPDYGALSGRRLDEQKAGARVAVDAHKKNPADFVLWKLSSENEPGWDSPWGRGRPGWHIECSAMSAAYLGGPDGKDVFDIHGGGLDLIFPHHENEIAQSRCAHGTPTMAHYWMHNGFLQVEGEKMSKSLGNFVTINELLKDWPGEVIRFSMLQTHYRQPIDFTVRRLEAALKALQDVSQYFLVHSVNFDRANQRDYSWLKSLPPVSDSVLCFLSDDLNTPAAIGDILSRASQKQKSMHEIEQLAGDCIFLGILNEEFPLQYAPFTFQRTNETGDTVLGPETIERVRPNFIRAKISSQPAEVWSWIKSLEKEGIRVEVEHGAVRISPLVGASLSSSDAHVESLIAARAAARAQKDFKESDRIRDELAAMGVVLKDGKDADGKPVTTWEIAR